MKVCLKCDERKDVSNFSRDKSKRDGLNCYCRDCKRDKNKEFSKKNPNYMRSYLAGISQERREKWRARERARAKNNPDKIYYSRIKRTYGLDRQAVESLLKSQNNLCFICERPEQLEKRFAVDHCHKTGKVRGLLCMSCNIFVGHLESNIDRLDHALRYINKLTGQIS